MNEKVEVFEDKTNFPSTEFLHINSCGVTNHSTAIRIYRPKGRVDFFLGFVKNGELIAEVGSKKIPVRKGQALVFFPNKPQDYTHLPSSDAQTFWVHFCGTAAEEIMKQAGISVSGRLLPVSPAETERIFRAVIKHHLASDTLSAAGYLLRLISSVSPAKEKGEGEGARLIRLEAENIAVNFFKDIDLDEAAERCHLSRTRFNHLFTKTVGVSPRKMQTTLRLERARELLSYSELSVAEISEQCGYGDPLYFSRIFTKAYSVSPSNFRKGFKA